MTVQSALTRWFGKTARPLPWRESGVTPWQILVSEIMLQQTPAIRVAPQWLSWIARWPDAKSLANASPADAIRQWDRLGYPNRALRLRQTAQRIVEEHGGQLPRDEAELRKLPGIGEYTAAAILAFAYEQRSVVLDTNVRRVITRVWHGRERQPATLGSEERTFAEGLVPSTAKAAARWSAAVMEFGAVICTAKKPQCSHCIIKNECAWRLAGFPASEIHTRKQQFHGTDRQVRGIIMQALKTATKSLAMSDLELVWQDSQQVHRALDSLVSDELVEVTKNGRYRLPQ